jgi:hypothetical protein
MSGNRPMSEHEGALFDAVLAIAATVMELGADHQTALRTKLEKARDAAEAVGNRHGAATLDFMLNSLFTPSDPAPKPALRIV